MIMVLRITNSFLIPVIRFWYIPTTDLRYDFDHNGNITAEQLAHRNTNAVNNYGYDAISRLTEADYHDSTAEAFEYDKVGNRLAATLRDSNSEDYTVDVLTNRYDTVTGHDYYYDAAGNMVEDVDYENYSAVKDYLFSYDYENRLMKVTLIDFSEQEGGGGGGNSVE